MKILIIKLINFVNNCCVQLLINSLKKYFVFVESTLKYPYDETKL